MGLDLDVLVKFVFFCFSGLGLLVVILSCCVFWDLIWNFIDDQKGLRTCKKFNSFTDDKPFIIPLILCTPNIIYLSMTFPWLPIVTGIIIALLFTARFARRLNKKLDLHEQLHNEMEGSEKECMKKNLEKS